MLWYLIEKDEDKDNWYMQMDGIYGFLKMDH